MSLQRRSVQELYLRALTDPNPEGYDLDFATILDCIWPSREKAIVSPEEREAVRGWVDELITGGILVRDHTKDRAKGDFYVLHPRYASNPDQALKDAQALPNPAPPRQFTPLQKSLLIAWVVAIAGLLFLFYSTFMPRELPAQILGAIALATAVLGLGGMHIQETGSFWDALWSRRTVIWLVVVSSILVGVLLLGYRYPCYVRAIPGATIYVDGNFYRKVPGDQGAPNRERLEKLYLAWGSHEVAVSKPWHVDYAARSQRSSRQVFAPSFRDDEPQTKLGVFVDFRLAAPEATGSPNADNLAARKLRSGIADAQRTLNKLFERLGDANKMANPADDWDLVVDHDHSASIIISGSLEYDITSRRYSLDVSCRDREAVSSRA